MVGRNGALAALHGAWIAVGVLGCADAAGEGATQPTDGDDGTTIGATTSDVSTAGDPASTGGATQADTGVAESSGEDGTTGNVGPTTSDGSTAGEESSTGQGVRCPEGHECFYLDGVFHVADEAEPTFIHSLPVQGAEFAAIEVELDVVHGGWFPDDPGGLHNIFWLHRGQFDNFTWMGGVAGYVNVRGPGSNLVRSRHDLDVTDLADSHNFNINGVALTEGSAYHVYYRYDTAAAEVTVEITEGGVVVAQGTDAPTTDRVRNNDNGFFIWFANPTDVEQPGPEVPSLGWSFADLRVEFIPQ